MDKATIASLSQKEWEELDLWKWLEAHYRAYAKNVAKAYRRRFGEVDHDEVQNNIYAAVYPALVSAHRRNLNAVGEKRNQVLFSTILVITTKRIPAMLNAEFPACEQKAFDFLSPSPEQYSRFQQEHTTNSESSSEWSKIEAIMYAAADADRHELDIGDECARREKQAAMEEQENSRRVEQLRTAMPNRWYQVLRMGICDRMTPKDIAEHLGVSQDTIYNIRSNTKHFLAVLAQSSRQIPTRQSL